MKPTNREQLTWICVCGMANVIEDGHCYQCNGDRRECWDEEDRGAFGWHLVTLGKARTRGKDTNMRASNLLRRN